MNIKIFSLSVLMALSLSISAVEVAPNVQQTTATENEPMGWLLTGANLFKLATACKVFIDRFPEELQRTTACCQVIEDLTKIMMQLDEIRDKNSATDVKTYNYLIGCWHRSVVIRLQKKQDYTPVTYQHFAFVKQNIEASINKYVQSLWFQKEFHKQVQNYVSYFENASLFLKLENEMVFNLHLRPSAEQLYRETFRYLMYQHFA